MFFKVSMLLRMELSVGLEERDGECTAKVEVVRPFDKLLHSHRYLRIHPVLSLILINQFLGNPSPK